jgi:hypothetical protein
MSIADDATATLTLRAHRDDVDQRSVTLVWAGALASRFGPYNDEALPYHRLYVAGLRGLLWSGEVLNSAWLAEVAPAVFRPPAHHYVVPTKEALVEVLADGLSVLREDA